MEVFGALEKRDPGARGVTSRFGALKGSGLGFPGEVIYIKRLKVRMRVDPKRKERFSASTKPAW